MQQNKGILFKHFSMLVLLAVVGCSAPGVKIEPMGDKLISDIETLASDEFEGRAPASPGGIKAVEFITSRFIEAGLKPANNGSYLQAVPLVEVTGYDISPLTISGNGQQFQLSYLDEMVVGSYRMQESLSLNNSELVFAGYGIVAPEYGWNDYEGLDVQGKTVVVMVNDPGFENPDEELFTGRAMTYYGRWTYKFEEAARQGAAGALIIHQTEPASYGWNVVRNSWSGTQYGVVSNGTNERLMVEGWLHLDAAQKVFEAAGVDFEQALQRAGNKSFEPMHLGLNASVSFKNEFKHAECYNVIGYIEGSKYPDETFVYMGHWDHLGKLETEEGVQIYNGAVDNATGIAGLIAIAEQFKKSGKTPERSVVFMAVTAEESGLLGSKFYAENPLFAVETTVGGINMDALNVYGATNDIVTVGYGFSEMDSYLKRHAATQGRIVKPNPYPERGYYYRSDHFNLAKQGVPMIYAKGGSDYIGQDEDYQKMVRNDYAQRYHQPTDVVHDLWRYEGIWQDLWLFYHIGSELANSDEFPNWSADSEFRAKRDSTEEKRRSSR